MSFQQRRYTDCDIMEITEYERLVTSETQALQSKMTAAIDASMNMIQTKQTELMDSIKSDPRRSAIRKKNIKLVLQISNEQEDDKNESEMLETPSVRTGGLSRNKFFSGKWAPAAAPVRGPNGVPVRAQRVPFPPSRPPSRTFHGFIKKK